MNGPGLQAERVVRHIGGGPGPVGGVQGDTPLLPFLAVADEGSLVAAEGVEAVVYDPGPAVLTIKAGAPAQAYRRKLL